jgi:beta-xylosidase
MIEAVMFWNEPNNKSHWDFDIDPQWQIYADMVKSAADAVASENAELTRVLGGISPIDSNFIRNMDGQGVLEALNAVAVHGFPLDWNHWTIHQ